MKQFYEKIIEFGNGFRHLLLLVLRLYWGFSFFQAGWGKLQNIEHVANYFQSLHIPLPLANAYIASSIECFGGLLLLVGFASRLIAIPLVFTMLVAYITTQYEALIGIFNEPDEFIAQKPFTYLLISLIIFACGPGMFSIDALLKRFVFKQRKQD